MLDRFNQHTFDNPRSYDVVVIKRDGTEVRGVMQDDSLQSLWPVKTVAGEVKYVSVLDTFVSKVER